MNRRIKIGAYVVLLGLAVWFGYGFFKNLSAATAKESPPVEPTNQVSQIDTNQEQTGAATNEATNSVSSTNVAAIKPNQIPAKPAAVPVQTRGQNTSAVMSYGAGLFAMIVCLGLLIAHDFSWFAAQRFEKFIFDEDLEGAKDPEYGEAEKAWANGNFLQAIQLMRDYLKEHPREQYVAIRIAEIYENDLGNYLAAALEYEEILKKKLPSQRWGWAAIHLANLYSGKLNRGQDAIALLQRIVAEYGHTAAAKKARERLSAEGIAIPEPVTESSAAPGEEFPPSNLPPGFTRKKS